MSIDKISGSKEELFNNICLVCSQLNITIRVDNDTDKHSQYTILREGKKSTLRVFVKPDGLKVDTTVGKNKELNSEIEEKLKLILHKTKQARFKYNDISEEKFSSIFQSLSELAIGNIILNTRENNDPNKSYFFEIKNRITKECITISKYNNGTLYVDGIVWILWEDVCQIIEMNSENISVNNIIDRILVEDEKVIVDDDFSKEEERVKEIISPKVYNFLSDNYKDYLISAQCILSNKYKMKEYSTVLCPVAKVLEGYLKSLLVELKLEKKLAIKGSWNFGRIFTKEGIKSFNGGHITDNQAEELEKLYILVREFRHDVNHGGPTPRLVIKNRTICENKYEEILKKIRDSYYIIFS